MWGRRARARVRLRTPSIGWRAAACARRASSCPIVASRPTRATPRPPRRNFADRPRRRIDASMALLAPLAPQASGRALDLRIRNSAGGVATPCPRPASDLWQSFYTRRAHLALAVGHAHPPPLYVSGGGARHHATAPRNRAATPHTRALPFIVNLHLTRQPFAPSRRATLNSARRARRRLAADARSAGAWRRRRARAAPRSSGVVPRWASDGPAPVRHGGRRRVAMIVRLRFGTRFRVRAFVLAMQSHLVASTCRSCACSSSFTATPRDTGCGARVSVCVCVCVCLCALVSGCSRASVRTDACRRCVCAACAGGRGGVDWCAGGQLPFVCDCMWRVAD